MKFKKKQNKLYKQWSNFKMKKISDLVLKGKSNSDIAKETSVYDLNIINKVRDRVINSIRDNISCKSNKVCKVDYRDAYEMCSKKCANYFQRKSNFLVQVRFK